MFKKMWDTVAARVHNNAKKKGFWKTTKPEPECIALLHSELSEALEAIRNSNPPSTKIPEFSQVEAELADVVIRVMDYAWAYKYNVAGAILQKIEFNETRPLKHGKKF